MKESKSFLIRAENINLQQPLRCSLKIGKRYSVQRLKILTLKLQLKICEENSFKENKTSLDIIATIFHSEAHSLIKETREIEDNFKTQHINYKYEYMIND